MAVSFFQNTAPKTEKPGMTKIFFIPIAHHLDNPLPAPATASVAAGDTAVATGVFDPDQAKHFIDLQNDLLKGAGIKWATTGEDSAPGEQVLVTGRANGFDKTLIEQFRNMKGVPCVVLVKDPDCATDIYKVVGCECNPAYPTFDFDTGELGGTTAKGFSFTFKSNCAPFEIAINSAALATLLAPAA